MTTKNVEYFRNECKNYYYFLASIEKIDLKIEEMQNRLKNLHGISYDHIVEKKNIKERPLLELITKIDRLEEDKKYYLEMLDWLQEVIDSIPNRSYRMIVWETFIMGKTLQEVAKEYDVSYPKLYTNRKNILDTWITDKHIKKNREIKKKYGRDI